MTPRRTPEAAPVNRSRPSSAPGGPAAAASRAPASAPRLALAGLVALAVAMGIGRFAFTPILPMMQADAGVSLRAGGWLAAANYLGYLVGALSAARLSTASAVRGGLLGIAAVTFAMGLPQPFAGWLLLRFLAGVASAWVLVHVSAWTLEQLLALGRPAWTGVVFAGVGVGIAAAGLACLALMDLGATSTRTWEALGVASLLLAGWLWPAFRGGHAPAHAAAAPRRAVAWTPDKRRLAACYAAFGFGYIVPATFLPALARQFIPDPALFGWAWPAFGAAAALSTLLAARWLRRLDDRRLWALAHALMALGVVLPVIHAGLATILASAVLVGGTFMVVTMTGLREGRRVAPEAPTAFIAVLTATFATGQILGPLVVSAVAGWRYGVDATLLAAAAGLVVTAVWILRPDAQRQ